MSDGFTIAAGSYAPTIFTCPRCSETIDSSAEACRFCGEKVDPVAAQQAALVLAKVNQACSDASYMKSSALVIPVFFFVRYLPFFSMVGGIGFIGLSFAVPIWSLRWWSRYGKLVSTDEEFLKARKNVRYIGIVVTCILVLLVLLPFVAGLLLRRSS
jgi:hypothetical protein